MFCVHAPPYRFVCHVPTGRADEQLREAVARDITAAGHWWL
jgi:hypothetical protein